MADEQDKTRNPRRRWLQFSLRTLMVFVVVASLPLAWMSNQARKHRQAMAEARRVVAEIQSKGRNAEFRVDYGNIVQNCPTWLKQQFGEPGVQSIVSASFDDDDTVLLNGMTKLTWLDLDGSDITDAGLRRVDIRVVPELVK